MLEREIFAEWPDKPPRIWRSQNRTFVWSSFSIERGCHAPPANFNQAPVVATGAEPQAGAAASNCAVAGLASSGWLSSRSERGTLCGLFPARWGFFSFTPGILGDVIDAQIVADLVCSNWLHRDVWMAVLLSLARVGSDQSNVRLANGMCASATIGILWSIAPTNRCSHSIEMSAEQWPD